MWGWAALAGLGAFHGLNPAMGWLFAVARGLQARQGAAVVQSLVPIAVGHVVSIALVVAAVEALRGLLDMAALQMLAASCLIGFGVFGLLCPNPGLSFVVRSSRFVGGIFRPPIPLACSVPKSRIFPSN